MYTGAVSLEPLSRVRIRGGEERREWVNYKRRGVMHKIEKGGYDSLSSLSAAIVFFPVHCHTEANIAIDINGKRSLHRILFLKGDGMFKNKLKFTRSDFVL